ncbi:bifunctional epoxide hydrolase 2-like [Tripterygium wilfordii]|uniref:Bifunctional epoxide hydrolase 2-like n=2 Tax=Tripterygium wilfordii TaxID=458696 RepID=A0A7J7DHZ4_TRIWF|nr:bifunctional epoxide hydrolase 2-like [Tripterygium wilfordii]
MDLVDPSTPLPPWFSEEDLEVYGSLYENSGFRFPLQVPYRALKLDCGISDPNPKVSAPALLIMGDKDYVLKMPGMEEFIRGGQMKHIIPNLDVTFLAEGSHFVQEQFPDQVNALIISFLNKNSI